MTLDGAPQPAGGPAPQAVTQPVAAPLTAAAIFLVVTVRPGQASDDGRPRPVRRSRRPAACGRVSATSDAALTCVMGFGAELWDRLAGPDRPAGLHPFREIRADDRHAVATPGRPAVPHPRGPDGPVLRAGHAHHQAAGRRRGHRRRGARLPLLRRPGPDRLRGRDGEPDRPGRGRGDGDRRRGPGVRRRQLRDRPEVPARPGQVECPAHRAAGEHHRPHQAGRHRTGRQRQAHATRTTR